MNRIAKRVNGKWVYDPPYTDQELAEKDRGFADMLASRRAPGGGLSDRVMWEGLHNNHGFTGSEKLASHYIQKAKKAGISISGKLYNPYLADKRGPADPNAWVGDTSDILAVCKRQNRDCAYTNYKAREVEPAADVPLADDIVQATMQEYLQRDPGRAKDLGGLREEIVEKHGAPANKKALSGKKTPRKRK